MTRVGVADVVMVVLLAHASFLVAEDGDGVEFVRGWHDASKTRIDTRNR